MRVDLTPLYQRHQTGGGCRQKDGGKFTTTSNSETLPSFLGLFLSVFLVISGATEMADLHYSGSSACYLLCSQWDCSV